MQKQLLDQYEKLKSSVSFRDDLPRRLSAPLCLYIPERWKNSKRRVLIVGQETLGWGFRTGQYYEWPYEPIANWQDFERVPDSVSALVHGYKIFEFALHQRNYSSPFWKAYRQFRKTLGEPEDGLETSVLWTNLFRMSLDGGSVIKKGSRGEVEQIRDASRDVLHAELRILKPTAVVFFTGPIYNETLYSLFPGMGVSSFSGRDPQKTARIAHAELPPMAWRTYHPKYLSLSRQWGVIDEILNNVCGRS